MVLPGVPRNRRIKFVKEVIELLLREGLEGITEMEYGELKALIDKLLDKTEPVPEKLEEKPDVKPEAC